MNSNEIHFKSEEIDFKKEFYKYFSFWPYIIISVIVSFIIAFIYLRYAEYKYISTAKIEIIDKSQDSEMSLPTAMTIFNRSMINVDNEIGVLESFSLHRKVVQELKSNVKFYTTGVVKSSENHFSEWFDDYDLEFNVDTESIKKTMHFELLFDDNKMNIISYSNDGDIIKTYDFVNLSTLNKRHDLPFDITVKSLKNLEGVTKEIKFLSFDNTVESFRSLVNITTTGSESDQLNLSLEYQNYKIANDYINTLVSEFDRDGIIDRQLEYKRTMDFVDSRSNYLSDELGKIELRRQEFKQNNKLTDIKSISEVSINQQFEYDSEIFKSRTQKDLTIMLKSIFSKDENDFNLMPVNIGLENSSINELILEYNLVVKERDRYLISAGQNNSLVINLEKQLQNLSKNILLSINNYEKSLDMSLENLISKEKEFIDIFQDIPENEKILRSIERELSIKESLFLLLLQKREEAAINYAVVRPSIKIVDHARNSIKPVSPRKTLIFLSSIAFGLIFPLLILFLWFVLDNKIHTRDELLELLPSLSLIGEIPHIRDKNEINSICKPNSRTPLAESIRMVIANLNFTLFNDKSKNNLILVTSSIKGEGKTVVSTNLASVLNSKYEKVLLIGADLRNPQLHKYFNIDKNNPGLTDYMFNPSSDLKDYILKKDNLDVLISGKIPPNPTELLSSNKFKQLLDKVKSEYDYVIIDSAPCVLVSDTFEISKYVDNTIYVVRANFTKDDISDFINGAANQGRLQGLNLILNGVGNSMSYGYKYAYQYGYKYGYNYGYGYGYSEDNE